MLLFYCLIIPYLRFHIILPLCTIPVSINSFPKKKKKLFLDVFHKLLKSICFPPFSLSIFCTSALTHACVQKYKQNFFRVIYRK